MGLRTTLGNENRRRPRAGGDPSRLDSRLRRNDGWAVVHRIGGNKPRMSMKTKDKDKKSRSRELERSKVGAAVNSYASTTHDSGLSTSENERTNRKCL